MVNANALSAYFFYMNNKDDPNAELSKEEELALKVAAQKFIDASTELLEILESQTYENEVDAQTPFYDVGKKYYGLEKKQLLSYFSQIYQLLFETKSGPRLGAFVFLYGKDNFLKMFRDRMNNPFYFIYF